MLFRRKEQKEVKDEEALRKLPHNRKEVFWDLIKHRKMTLFALSCFTFMFFIPLAVDLFYFNFIEVAAIASEKYEYLFSLVLTSMLIMIPCMIIGFIGLSGAFYTAKRLVWQEDVSLGNDFFKGIKENLLQGFINGLIFGVVLFGLVVGGTFLLVTPNLSEILKGIGIGALILLVLTFGMVIPLNFAQSVYYSNSYRVTLKNSFSFLGLLNWRILVTFLLSTGVVITLCCFNFITLAIGLFLFAILNSVVVIIYTLLAHHAFDKYINQEHYPEYVGKGLYKPNTSSKVEETKEE